MRIIYILGAGFCVVLLAYNLMQLTMVGVIYLVPTVVGLGALATSLAGAMTLDD